MVIAPIPVASSIKTSDFIWGFYFCCFRCCSPLRLEVSGLGGFFVHSTCKIICSRVDVTDSWVLLPQLDLWKDLFASRRNDYIEVVPAVQPGLGNLDI